MALATDIELILALQAARNRILSGRNDYICVALHCARDDGLCTRHASRELREYIEAQLDGCGMLEMYLEQQGVIKLDRSTAALRIVVPGIDIIYCPVATEYLRPARLAWIDRMIHELQTNGRLP